MKKAIILLGIIFMSALAQSSNIYPQSSGYKIVGVIDIGGDGGWDYLFVDETAQRLYVSHSTKIHIIDLSNNKVIGEIGNQHGVHGIAPVASLEKGYISNGKDSTVTVFNLKTFKIISSIKIKGRNPDAIIYDPFSGRVFTFNNGSKNATAIDPVTDKVIGTIELGGAPEFAATDLKGKMFVNLEDKNAISSFDTKNLKVLSTWSISPVSTPSGLALDRENNRLFSVGRNKLMAIVDAVSGKLISTVPIGDGVDGCAFDQKTKYAFSSNGEGSITVVKEVSPSEFKVTDTVATQKGARTVTVDQSTHRVYTIALIEGKENKKSFGVLILDSK